MGNIFIVRHGQDEDNAALILNGRRDKPLTRLGRQQAKIVADKLRPNEINIIYSSPLKRAFETAQIIARELEIRQIIKHPDLLEREFGILTGKPIADIPKFANKILHADKVDYFLDADGAEDFESIYKRAKSVLQEINKKYPDKNVLIVTHSDIGKMLRAVFLSRSWQEELRTPYFANADILELNL